MEQEIKQTIPNIFFGPSHHENFSTPPDQEIIKVSLGNFLLLDLDRQRILLLMLVSKTITPENARLTFRVFRKTVHRAKLHDSLIIRSGVLDGNKFIG